MNAEKTCELSFFHKYLTLWAALCTSAGILLGAAFPGVAAFLVAIQRSPGAVETEVCKLENATATNQIDH